MTPQELRRLEKVEAFIANMDRSDRLLLDRHLQLEDGKNFQLGTAHGTKIGTSSTQKIGFLGATPVTQHAVIPAPVGGDFIDSEARAATILILAVLSNIGLTASA